MGRRLSRKAWPGVTAIAVLLLAVEKSGAQAPPVATAPAPAAEAPRTAGKAPSLEARPLSKGEVDQFIEKAFGRDSEEMRRPIRLWISNLGLVIAAKEAGVTRDGHSVRFKTASIAIVDAREGTAEVRAIRGEEAILVADRAVTQWGDLKTARVTMAEVNHKNAVITLAPGPAAQVQPAPAAPAPQPPPAVVDAASAPITQRVIVEGPGTTPAGKIQVVSPDTFVSVAQATGLALRFKFVVDPKASPGELLPAPPKTIPTQPAWTNEDLAKVPEVAFGEPLSRDLEKVQAMQQTAHTMAKINHLNLKKTDGFMQALLNQRTDLGGLPVLMGEECRTREDQARVFKEMASAINEALRKLKTNGGAADGEWMEIIASIQGLNAADAKELKAMFGRGNLEQINRAIVAATMQILMPEAEPVRVRLAKFLATIPHADATKALARLAIFSPEESVRAAAIEGLKLRREKDYTDVLIQGFRYPLPAVSRRAAEALVKLERKDLLDALVQVLELPDPRLPVKQRVDGKEVAVLRELVRVNHNRNCMLCHAPANTSNVPEGILTAAVPLPSEPLPKPSDGGYQSVPPPSPDIVVRIDMTYLRQDFSQMMPVANAHPWPDLQRFDFLVRTRVLTPAEAEAYPACCETAAPGSLSPYQRAALFALRELTGRDAEPTPQAWRKLLKSL
jgi:hypothetical protein